MRSLLGGVADMFSNKSPVSHAPRGIRMPWVSRNDTTAQMRAYGAVSTLFAIVNRTSNATSQVNWRLWRKPTGARGAGSSEAEQRTEVTRHAALDLWRKPNPFYTQQELVEVVQQHLDLTGEGWMVIGRDPRSKLPLELWPVRPDRMSPVPHATKYLAGYMYTSPDGEQVPLGLDDVLFLRMPNPLDPYRGMGPVQAAMVDVDSARYSAQWNRNFFINSAEPGGVIEVDKRLTDDEFTEMTTRWREQHQGVAQAHRVAVLEQGKWVERKFNQKDMQFAELRGISREILREAYGMHGHMLGISENVNKANAEAGEISFARWLVVPRAQRWKQVLNTRLLHLYGAADKLEFDHDRVVPEDREADDRERTSKAQAAQLLVTAGFEPKGTLAAFGLPDIPFVGKPDKPEEDADE